MKRLQLILNIVLALAVIAMFVLHFTGIGSTKKNNDEASITAGTTDNSKIFYLRLDSLFIKYEMSKDLTAELQSKSNSSEATLKSKQQAYEKDVNDYQYKAQRGLITRDEASTIEQTLYTKQQELYTLQQNLSSEIAEKQSVMTNQVINAVMEYLKENSAKYNYTFVLGTTFGDNVLYANDSLNISDDIIKGLNEKYQQDKKKK